MLWIFAPIAIITWAVVSATFSQSCSSSSAYFALLRFSSSPHSPFPVVHVHSDPLSYRPLLARVTDKQQSFSSYLYTLPAPRVSANSTASLLVTVSCKTALLSFFNSCANHVTLRSVGADQKIRFVAPLILAWLSTRKSRASSPSSPS